MKQTKSFGEVVDQAVRPGAGRPPVEDARVVLDAGAEADLAQHLHVVLRALAQAVRLEQLALLLQDRAARVELAADLGHRVLELALLDVVVRGGPDGDVLDVVADQLARQRVEVLQALDLVAEEHGPEGRLLVGGEDLQRVAAHAERAAAERLVVAVVLERDELAQELVAVDRAALDQHLAVGVVGLGRAEAEDGGHRGDDHDVAAGEERRRRRVAEPVDLLVDRRVLLDVEVARGDVRLGLVVVVVRDEVLDRVAAGSTSGTRCRAGPRASCCGRGRAPAAGASRWSRPSSSSCPCRWRRAGSRRARPPPPPPRCPSIAAG